MTGANQEWRSEAGDFWLWRREATSNDFWFVCEGRIVMARETDVEALWGNLSGKQRQAVLGILLRDIAEAYRMSDDDSKMRWSGPILELIEMLERLRRDPADSKRGAALEAIELGVRFTSQILPKGQAPSGRETQ